MSDEDKYEYEMLDESFECLYEEENLSYLRRTDLSRICNNSIFDKVLYAFFYE